MSEHRVSGYKRVERDAYQTIEPWVTHALLDSFPMPKRIWEPAAGDGHMVRALEARGHEVYATDIVRDQDFLTYTSADLGKDFAIVTNPPFGERGKLAEAFIRKALALTRPSKGIVAMLLPTDFDHAATRQFLFRHPAYSLRLILLRRPRWFAGDATPKTNFVWQLWDWRDDGPPQVFHHGGGE